MSSKVAVDPQTADGEMRTVVTEEQRRTANGETEALMAHAKETKSKRPDTTVDDKWEIQEDLASTDRLVLRFTVVFLVVKLIIFWVPLFLLFMPVAFVMRIYGAILPVPTDRIERHRLGFALFAGLSLFLSVPSLCLSAGSRFLDGITYYAFNIPYCCLSRGGWARRRRGLAVIAPYTGGPWIPPVDVLVCIIGQSLRQGPIEIAWSLATMVVVIPWYKYFVLANPYVYELEERFVQQISTSMADCGVQPMADAGLQIIARSKQERSLRQRQDKWLFMPHYPYPPPSRRWAVGMQANNSTTLLTHSTHAYIEPGSKDHFVFSNSAEKPLWRVVLWYNNPFHMLTGFVEASISNGNPSQPDKYCGAEHPMWLVSARSPMTAGRNNYAGAGSIDAFFDKWLPSLVDEARSLIRGPEIARALHQEVISKDGISRPASEIGPGDPRMAPSWNPRLAEVSP